MKIIKHVLKSFVFILFVYLQACIKENPEVKIKNSSTFVIDSVKIFAHQGFNETVFKYIKPNELRKGKIHFENIPKQDGVSIVIFYYNQQEVHKGLGYYTNGGNLDYGFNIIFKSDTIILNRY